MARLPVELYGIVLRHCSPADLATFARVSRTTQLEAERILYRDVKFPGDLMSNANRGTVISAIMFCKRIRQSPRRAAYVISLLSTIGVFGCYFPLTLRKLFSRAIASMPHLRILRFLRSELLDFSILARCHFKLWTFESDSDDKTALVQFLINTHHELRSLSLWLLFPRTIYSELSPHLFPNLTVLLACERDASHIMSGRPISHLCIWDMPGNIPGPSTLIKVLRLDLVFHTTMESIARAAPNVEVLYVSPDVRDSNVRPAKPYQHRYLLSDVPGKQQNMEAFVIPLSRLKNLHTLELRFDQHVYWSSAAEIAQAIIKACHSLHTLILNQPFFSIRRDAQRWWIWKSGKLEIEPGEGIRDSMQLWNEEIAKLGL
jgi:hypothetical protein